MIKFAVKNIKISLGFSFFAVIALFLCFDTSGFGLLGVTACLIHETGHLIAMAFRGEMPSEIKFYGGGVRINRNTESGTGYSGGIITATAGSALNLAVFFALYFALPKNNIYPVIFAVLNLIIGLFNLLPVGYLDGKILLEMFLIKKLAPETALKLLYHTENITAAVFFAAVLFLFFSNALNFTSAAVLIYLMTVDIFDKL